MRGRKSGLEMDMDIAWLLQFVRTKLRYLKPYADVDRARAEVGLGSSEDEL